MGLNPTYLLVEVAKILYVSPALVNRIQRVTGLVKKDGGKGIRSYYTKEDISILKKIVFLRVLNIPFNKIPLIISNWKEYLPTLKEKKKNFENKIKLQLEFINDPQ